MISNPHVNYRLFESIHDSFKSFKIKSWKKKSKNDFLKDFHPIESYISQNHEKISIIKKNYGHLGKNIYHFLRVNAKTHAVLTWFEIKIKPVHVYQAPSL